MTPANDKIINELHHNVRDNFRRFVTEVEDSLGYNVTLTDGYRTWAESAVFKQQNPKNATPGYSSHNYGMALDLVLTKNGTTLHKADSLAKWNATGVPKLAKEKYKMRWGGDFNGYPDTVHFDYQNIFPTKVLYQLALAQFGENINKVEGNKVVIPEGLLNQANELGIALVKRNSGTTIMVIFTFAILIGSILYFNKK